MLAFITSYVARFKAALIIRAVELVAALVVLLGEVLDVTFPVVRLMKLGCALASDELEVPREWTGLSEEL